MDKYEVRESAIEGRGLYATEKIRQGETILIVAGKAQSYPDMYSIQIAPDVHINTHENPISATNHSCDPNAAIRLNIGNGARLVAWKCIEAGEEITFDYKVTESKLAEPFDCLCGAKNCRGRIE